MKFWSKLTVGSILVLAACASEETTDGPPSGVEGQGPLLPANSGAEDSRQRTERRLQLSKSVDQWWLAYQRQEFGKAESIAAALESYVDRSFDGIVADLSTASPRFRKVAAAAIGFSGREDAIPLLVKSLKDPFTDVILASLLSMWRLALVEVNAPAREVVPYLSHPDEEIRGNAAMVLAHVAEPGDGTLFLPLTSAMEDSSARVRVHAAAALGALKDSDAISFLSKGLSDPKALVRIRSAYALGRISDRRSVPILIKHIDDPDTDVAKAVHKALKVITSAEIPRIKSEWVSFWDQQPKEN